MRLYLNHRHQPLTEEEWHKKFHRAWEHVLFPDWVIIECADNDVEKVKHLLRFNRLVQMVQEGLDGMEREKLGIGMNQPFTKEHK